MNFVLRWVMILAIIIGLSLAAELIVKSRTRGLVGVALQLSNAPMSTSSAPARVSLRQLVDVRASSYLEEPIIALKDSTTGAFMRPMVDEIEVDAIVINKAKIQNCKSRYSNLPDTLFANNYLELSQDGSIGVVRVDDTANNYGKGSTVFDTIKIGDKVAVAGSWNKFYECSMMTSRKVESCGSSLGDESSIYPPGPVCGKFDIDNANVPIITPFITLSSPDRDRVSFLRIIK